MKNIYLKSSSYLLAFNLHFNCGWCSNLCLMLVLLLLLFSRCEVGTENWTQCNDHPIKICKYPVSGLFEGHSYYFRVRAVNSHGISKPSRMSDPIAAMDPTELERLHGECNSLVKCFNLFFLTQCTVDFINGPYRC